ncbi:MAG: VOC family protein [Exiguobacterium chiriqhucha]|jgi:methylmalonyl-CoA/ethylmalonyl-CoA epimerase|uniref:VOC family protein n=1 Tax=Exiguobacterium TaxID=33986 RepID=UPI00103AC772|nr:MULTISPECIES: VOC family protein [Exiguobacterium]KAB2860679.1 MAG: VOC family protein [Exiguobacterium chiriqhucha]TCI68273.1 VOC family protein [Exiguobacterium sp. IPCI3]TCI77512.1 VOC family protein [Exiguobacterium sp. IPCH1]TCI79086.1 VOC family protein [Exiguobacterium sp. IPBC4]
MHIDHTGIAVRDLDEAITFYTTVLQGKLVDRYTNTAIGVETEIAVIHVGDDVIELLLPTSPTSPIARFMKARGKGVHHIAYRVEDLDESIESLKRDGVTFLEDTLRTTAKGRRLIYMDPRHSGGVIVELCDYPTIKQ